MISQALSVLVVLSNGAPSGTLLGAEQLGYAGIAAAPAPLGYAEVAAAPAALGYAEIAAAPATLGYAEIGAAPAAFGYAEIAPAVTAVHETLHAGPAVAETVVHHGVVGSRTVQVLYF